MMRFLLGLLFGTTIARLLTGGHSSVTTTTNVFATDPDLADLDLTDPDVLAALADSGVDVDGLVDDLTGDLTGSLFEDVGGSLFDDIGGSLFDAMSDC